MNLTVPYAIGAAMTAIILVFIYFLTRKG